MKISLNWRPGEAKWPAGGPSQQRQEHGISARRFAWLNRRRRATGLSSMVRRRTKIIWPTVTESSSTLLLAVRAALQNLRKMRTRFHGVGRRSRLSGLIASLNSRRRDWTCSAPASASQAASGGVLEALMLQQPSTSSRPRPRTPASGRCPSAQQHPLLLCWISTPKAV